MIRILSFIALSLFVATAYASAANPVMPFSSLGKERGFRSILVYNDDKTGFTDVRVTLQPDVFLGHFKHGFSQDRAQCHVDLRPRFKTEIRGVSVDLGVFKVSKEEFSISFSVPTEHLKEYELWFSCSITSDQVPVIGGETYIVSLDTLRSAEQAILETNPIWAKLGIVGPSSEVNASREHSIRQNPEQGGAAKK